MGVYDSVVITGANGMLGHALADFLAARGVKAVGLSRGECDVANESDLARMFECRPTLVLNCAAHTKVDMCEQERERAMGVNGAAVGRMAEGCRRVGAFLVHVSTDFVFDGKGRRPYGADDPVGPLSMYGKSKLAGERALQASELTDWLIVRTAWVYGRHGANFPRTMVTAARAGKQLSVVSDQIGSPTYAPDLAGGILGLLDAGKRGVWHVTNSGETSWYEFARAALGEFGLTNEVSPLTSAQWKAARPNTAARPGYSVLDIRPFAEATGRGMRDWREGIRDYREAVEREGF